MKVVADENILLLDYYFQGMDISLQEGRAITRESVKEADILLVRSVTPVNAKLLENTSVRFVGSTTAGCDHLDIAWLEKSNMAWAVAKGCNAPAVMEYVMSVIAALQQEKCLTNENKRAAVIGVGNIGERVAAFLRALKFEVLLYDPFRARKEKHFPQVTFDEIANVDLITLHTPLTHTGEFPTFHLIEKKFLQRQKTDCVMLNTSRGAVIHSNDLKQYGRHLIWCLDVFEEEPNIDLDILHQAKIATPHIAGYTLQSKYRGIDQVYRAAIEKKILPEKHLPPSPLLKDPSSKLSPDFFSSDWQTRVLQQFDPRLTSLFMKKSLWQGTYTFDQIRKNFRERDEFGVSF